MFFQLDMAKEARMDFFTGRPFKVRVQQQMDNSETFHSLQLPVLCHFEWGGIRVLPFY